MINRTSRVIVCSILAMLAVLGTLFCVTSAFSLYVQPLTLIAVTILASVMFTAAFQYHKLLLTLIPTAIVVLLIIFAGGSQFLASAAQQLIHEILTKFSAAYQSDALAIPPESAVFQSSYYTILFCLLAYLLSLWMAWGIGYRSCLISIAGPLPFLLLCVIINDTPPSVAPLILLITVWITVLLAELRPEDAGLVDATRLTLVFLAALLVFGCIGIAYPKDDTSSETMPKIIEQLLELLPENVSNLLSRDSKSGTAQQQLGADTAEVLDLTTQGARSTTEDLMMQLSSTESGVLYLRGAAKDIYTGTSWESTDQATPSESEYAQTSLGAAFGSSNQAAVQIKNYRDNTSVAFIPYGYLSSTGTEEFSSDLRVSANENDYIVYYWPGVSTLDLTETYDNTNQAYDAYVRENCLSLPDGVRDTLYQLALDYGYDPELSEAEKIAWVASFIRSCGTYRTDVACQPADQDFAVYFLTESKAGYCVHYATAACAMYRALGIPSRYASGYRVSVLEAETVVDITDDDTHAWAEVYISGLGWIPVETTPGFEAASMLPELSEDAAPAEPEEPTEAEPQDQTDPEGSAEEAEAAAEEEEEEEQATETAEPSASPSPSEAPGEEEQTEENPEATPEPETTEDSDPYVEQIFRQTKSHLPLILLSILLLIVLGILVLVVRARIIMAQRSKLFRQTDRDSAVIALWAYLETLESWHASQPDEIHSIALKAKFSQHKLSNEEYSKVYAFVSSEYERVYQGLTFWQRLRFTFLSALKCTSFR